MRGRDIQRYYADFQDLWLIGTHNGYSLTPRIEVDNYPAIKEFLNLHLEQIEKRYDKGDTPYNLRNCAYWQDFEKPKIIYPNMTKFLPFIIDKNSFYTNQKCFILAGENLFFLCGFLNSNLFKFCFRDNFPELLGGTRELSKVFFEEIPVLKISPEQENPFQNLVETITHEKQKNPDADTSELEAEIDKLVYSLYELTPEEIAIVEESVKR